ncbi:MAG: PorP/SprF family type IX secretion system membrane protein [Bacteroidetes bacterium]|nr:PorP/SprF family type IX secretion system membrane protein [Bacteroidota bacterium]MBS1630371.1 PorP/SprF family type IX secretion system membrane protein [Bacteroidota bacterium]
MKRILLSLGLAIAALGIANAQDIHHTQYFASPLTLNPALTGLVRGDLRVAANYRSQWYSVSNHPYQTGVISFDMATLKNRLPEGDALGIGLIGTYDRSGVGALQAIQIGISAAYHKAFGLEKQHTLSFGVQGVLVQKSIDFSMLKFEDQFDPNSGQTPYNTAENLDNKDLTYPDFNLGLMYSGRVSDYATAYIGGSVFHLTTPTESFLSSSNTIHRRYNVYLGGSFDLNENMELYASALYQNQASATEVMLGAAAGFILNPGHEEAKENTIFYLGGWYRYGDGLCPYIGLEWTKMALGISYDVNTSSFTPATGGAGAYELSLTFNGKIVRHAGDPNYNFSCPKF